MPTYKSYIAGFILSVFFTILAFSFAMEHLLTGNSLIAVLIALALVQAWVQLAFFLHLKPGARWNMAVFLSTVSLIFILVVGTLWIMSHLISFHNSIQSPLLSLWDMEE